MATERSDKLHADLRASTEKFDYFVLGALGALCAFIGQGYRPSKIGVNPSSLELVALIFLIFAVVSGFRRIEKTLLVTALNQRELHANEARGGIVSKMQSGQSFINHATGEIFDIETAHAKVSNYTQIINATRPQLEFAKNDAYLHYRIRNIAALAGFCILLSARIWTAYV